MCEGSECVTLSSTMYLLTGQELLITYVAHIIHHPREGESVSGRRCPRPAAAGESIFLFHFFYLLLSLFFFGAAVKTQVTSRLSQIKAHKVLEKMAREAWRGERVASAGYREIK